MLKRILFYGDSNTRGYDPRSYFGERYPEENVWTSLLSEKLGPAYEVINQGLNGRQLPHSEYEYRHISFLMNSLGPEDTFAVMLGTNDLFLEMPPNAERPAERMEKFLDWAVNLKKHPRLLVVAPPAIDPEESADPVIRTFAYENTVMAEEFRKLTERFGIPFIDASGWKIDIAFDGVHFSENGHAGFAEKMPDALRQTGILP